MKRYRVEGYGYIGHVDANTEQEAFEQAVEEGLLPENFARCRVEVSDVTEPNEDE